MVICRKGSPPQIKYSKTIVDEPRSSNVWHAFNQRRSDAADEQARLLVSRRLSALIRWCRLSLCDSLSTLMFSIDLLMAFIRCSSSLPIRTDAHVDDEIEHVGVLVFVTVEFVEFWWRGRPHEMHFLVAGKSRERNRECRDERWAKKQRSPVCLFTWPWPFKVQCRVVFKKKHLFSAPSR